MSGFCELEFSNSCFFRRLRSCINPRADCFVLSSFYETFGVVLIEAMSCGIPVLSTRSGGPETIIKSNDYGYLCELNELPEFMEKIALKLMQCLSAL